MSDIRLIVEELNTRYRIQEVLSRHGYSVTVGWGSAEPLLQDTKSAILVVDCGDWRKLGFSRVAGALEDSTGVLVLADEEFVADHTSHPDQLPNAVEIVRKPVTSEEILFRIAWLKRRSSTPRDGETRSSRARESYFRSLLESAPIGILLIDAEGKIIELNNRLIRIVGAPSREIVKSRNVLTYHHLVDGGFSSDVFQCLKTGRSTTNEKSYRDLWTKEIVLRCHMNRVHLPDHAGPQVQVIVENVTEMRRMDRQLLQAQNLRSLETPSGGIAHEFNNMLQVISGNAELIAQEASVRGNEVRAEIVEIQTAAARAADLTKGLLAFAANVSIELRPTDIKAETAACMSLLRDAIPHSLVVEVEPMEGLPPVLIDKIRFRQKCSSTSQPMQSTPPRVRRTSQ